MISAELVPKLERPLDAITVATDMEFHFRFLMLRSMEVQLSLLMNTATGLCVFNVTTPSLVLAPGQHNSVLKIPGRLMNDDIYSIDLLFVKETSSLIYTAKDLLTFEVADEPRKGNWFGKWYGVMRPRLDFTLD